MKLTISYKKRFRYKYTLFENYRHPTDFRPPHSISTRFIDLDTNGLLTIKKNYAWDGPSGPAFDTQNIMRGSLVHDALYQLMRDEYIPLEKREIADWLLREICLQDGMSKICADWVYIAVNFFGEPNAKPDLLQAP